MQSLIQLDQTIASQFFNFVASSPLLARLFIILGVGLVYAIPFLLVYVWFVYSRKDALKAVIAGILDWEGLSKLIAHLVNRARPSFSQIGVKELVFHRPDTSFPSDHSAFLMAIAVTFYLSGHKKLGHLVLVTAVIVGTARVGIGVHFPGDILAGWIVGIIVALLIQAIEEPLDRYLIQPIISLARRLHL